MSASIWAPGSTNIPVADPKSQIKSETFTAIEGQTDFVITQFTYHPGGGALEVYVNGAKLKSADVSETGDNTFTVAQACDVGDVVEAVGNTEMASADGAAVTAANAAAAAEVSKLAAEVAQLAAEASELAAASSESNAAAHASTALAQVDVFDDLFLGVKAAAPVTDNDGNALQSGAMYFNSTSHKPFIWNGSAWAVLIAEPLTQTLTDAATVAWDWALGNGELTLSASRTLGNPTNAADGEYRTLRVGRGGAFSLSAFGAKFKGVSVISQTAVSGAIDHFVFRYDSSADQFELVGFRANVGV